MHSPFLSHVEPFNRLPAFEVARLTVMSRTMTFDKGEVVFNEGETSRHVWVLVKGRLQSFKYSTEGRPIAFESLQPKQIFGILDRFSGNVPNYTSTVVACVDSEAIQIPEGIFRDLCRQYPAMVSSVCGLCSQRLAALQEAISFSQEPVQTRVLKTLFRLQETNGNQLPYTKREISELSQTTVESAIRVLSIFQKRHWIASKRGVITLTDIPRLQSLLAPAVPERARAYAAA